MITWPQENPNADLKQLNDQYHKDQREEEDKEQGKPWISSLMAEKRAQYIISLGICKSKRTE